MEPGPEQSRQRGQHPFVEVFDAVIEAAPAEVGVELLKVAGRA